MFKPTYLKLFNLELMIESTNNSGLSYLKDSANERELQIGKVRVIISG
jgi:hypothetical protein